MTDTRPATIEDVNRAEATCSEGHKDHEMRIRALEGRVVKVMLIVGALQILLTIIATAAANAWFQSAYLRAHGGP